MLQPRPLRMMRRRLRLVFLAIFVAGLATVLFGPLVGNSESTSSSADQERTARSRQRTCVFIGLSIQAASAVGYLTVAARTHRRTGRNLMR